MKKLLVLVVLAFSCSKFVIADFDGQAVAMRDLTYLGITSASCYGGTKDYNPPGCHEEHAPDVFCKIYTHSGVQYTARCSPVSCYDITVDSSAVSR